VRRGVPSGFSALLLATLLVSGCGSSESEQASQTENAPEGAEAEALEPSSERAAESLGGAFIEGVVRLDSEYAEVPLYSMEDIGLTPANSARPDGCPPVRRTARRPLTLAEDRGVGGVLVSISREVPFSREPPGEPQRRVVNVEQCMLTPALMVARRGDSLVVRNESDHMFMPRITNDPFMQGLMPNQERVIPLGAAGRVVDIRCQLSTGCGRTDVVVLGHPYFDITDEQGRFRIEGLPPGDYRVHAWHPLIPEAATEVTAFSEPASEPLVLTVRGRASPAGPSESPEEARRVGSAAGSNTPSPAASAN